MGNKGGKKPRSGRSRKLASTLKGAKSKEDSLALATVKITKHSWRQKLITYSKKGSVIWTIVGVLIAPLSLPSLIKEIRNLFLSENEIHENQNFIKGILIPHLESSKCAPNLIFHYGKNDFVIPLSDLVNNEYHMSRFIGKENGESPFNLKLLVKNSRLFMYAELFDIQKEEYVGEINYGYWSLFWPNLLKFNSTDTSLEVLDRGKKVIFRMAYHHPNVVNLQGYYFGREKTYVINDSVKYFNKSPGSRQAAVDEINKIKSSLFPTTLPN